LNLTTARGAVGRRNTRGGQPGWSGLESSAGRIVANPGKLIIVDFAPHGLEFLREQHQHRRLGFSDAEMKRWLGEAGFPSVQACALPPAHKEGLTVKIWTAERGVDRRRSAA